MGSAVNINAATGGLERALLALFRRWDISDATAARTLGSANPGDIDNIRLGRHSLKTRDERDRAQLLLNIYEGVFSLLRDQQSEKAWIRSPREDFNGQSIWDLLAEGSQRNLIRAQAFVDYANGR